MVSKSFTEWLYLPLTWQDVAANAVFLTAIVVLIIGWRLTRKNK